MQFGEKKSLSKRISRLGGTNCDIFFAFEKAGVDFMSIVEELTRARKVSVPIVAIATLDQANTAQDIKKGFNGDVPSVQWDAIRGLVGLNDLGAKELSKRGIQAATTQNPLGVWEIAPSLPDQTILVMHNAHRLLEDLGNIQGISNLRDIFTPIGAMLVLLGPDFQLPPELAQDVLIMDESLPTKEGIKEIVADQWGTPPPNGPGIKKAEMPLDPAAEALVGLATFPIEQAAALSVKKVNGKIIVDIEDLWARKRRMIRQVPGLSMESWAESFDQIGGLAQVKLFAQRLFSGPRRPAVVCFIDEIEKMMGGSGAQGFGDSSGVSQDQLGVMLSSMEDNKWAGLISVGPPGSGKSLLARAIASTYKVPLIKIDLGAAKGSLVGQSEQQIRTMMKTIKAMAEERAFFVATCNKLDTLPPELRRRFRFGLWFFDLPDETERLTIGQIQSKKLKIKDDPEFWIKNDGWSGANQRDVCELAYAMKISIAEAASYIVPAAVQDMAGLERLRAMADGKFLSASMEGPYKKDKEVKKGRRMDL